MKAVLLTAYGDVDRLQLREVAEPTAGPNEIKVRMAGASINPIDWKLRGGAYHAFMPLQLPTILGRDASGTVVAVGPGVTGFAIGARVMGRVNATYAELVVGPTEAWTPVPPGMELVDAAAYPLVLLTGAQLVEDAIHPAHGEQVLVTGATGSSGRVAVFAAKAAGARVRPASARRTGPRPRRWARTRWSRSTTRTTSRGCRRSTRSPTPWAARRRSGCSPS